MRTLGTPTIKQTSGASWKQVHLAGSSRERRKQYREILRAYPDCRITRAAVSVKKNLTSGRVEVEEANAPQTIITIHFPEAKK